MEFIDGCIHFLVYCGIFPLPAFGEGRIGAALGAAATPHAGFSAVVQCGKIAPLVRDDGSGFVCHFERMREIFPQSSMDPQAEGHHRRIFFPLDRDFGYL